MQVISNKKIVVEYTYKCDICGKAISHRTCCSICDRDICSSCMKIDPRDMGDYPRKYCIDCFNIGKKYLAQIATEEEKHEAMLGDIESNWKDEAIQKLSKG